MSAAARDTAIPSATNAVAKALPLPADLPERRNLAGLFSAAISIALLAMVIGHIGNMSFAAIEAMIPANPLFWIAFAACYMTIPVSEWVIFHRLWNLPLSAMGALLRKLVSNELLLGYLGEAQFYAWARSKVPMEAAPFGAIKDSSILSALAGNVMTVALLIPAWFMLGTVDLSQQMHTVFNSLLVVLASSFAIMLFRRGLFSLPAKDLRFIAAMHLGRISVQLILWAVMWHLVLPQVALSLWFVMATLRMLISRLPLVPNKDVLFAGIAVYVIGHQARIDDLMTMMAGLILAAHLGVGAVASLIGLTGQLRAK